MAAELAKVLEKAKTNGKWLDKEDILSLLSAGPSEAEELFAAADAVRARFLGEEVHLRGIIEFSNYCIKNCLYCGLRKDNKRLVRYRLKPDEILAAARKISSLGLKTVVLQSGEDPYYKGSVLAGIISQIKDELDVAVTLSVGDRSREDYALFRRAGADRYLLKHETSNPQLFSALRPGTQLKDRLLRLEWLKELGYQVGAGNMVGLPGQTLDSLAGDICLMRELDVEMAGIGPFIPHPDTPLANSTGGTLEMTLKVLAVTRLVLPHTHLPATTAAASVHPNGRVLALKCGANVVMPNMTPAAQRPNYSIYPGKLGSDSTPEDSFICALGDIKKAGRRPGKDYGHYAKQDLD